MHAQFKINFRWCFWQKGVRESVGCAFPFQTNVKKHLKKTRGQTVETGWNLFPLSTTANPHCTTTLYPPVPTPVPPTPYRPHPVRTFVPSYPTLVPHPRTRPVPVLHPPHCQQNRVLLAIFADKTRFCSQCTRCSVNKRPFCLQVLSTKQVRCSDVMGAVQWCDGCGAVVGWVRCSGAMGACSVID